MPALQSHREHPHLLYSVQLDQGALGNNTNNSSLQRHAQLPTLPEPEILMKAPVGCGTHDGDSVAFGEPPFPELSSES